MDIKTEPEDNYLSSHISEKTYYVPIDESIANGTWNKGHITVYGKYGDVVMKKEILEDGDHYEDDRDIPVGHLKIKKEVGNYQLAIDTRNVPKDNIIVHIETIDTVEGLYAQKPPDQQLAAESDSPFSTELPFPIKNIKTEVFNHELCTENMCDVKSETHNIKEKIPTTFSIKNKIEKNKARPNTVVNFFRCDQCEFKSAQYSRLMTHEISHNVESENPHKKSHTGVKTLFCNQCDFKTTLPSHLKMHKMSHSGEKPFKCDFCDFKSAQTSNLKKHVMAHTGEKPFKCDQCDFKTARSSHLKTHKMSHTGEMPFKCDQCDFKSVYSFVLKTHKKSHSGVMPYKCDVCEYASLRPFALKIHKMSHTGEKPFKCGQCDYKSAQSSNVRKHILLHDGDKIIRRGKPVKS